MSIELAKPVATEILVIRMSLPFAAKPAANWVMKKCFVHGADACFGLILGLISTR